MKDVPKIQIYIGFFMAIITFLQAFSNWGERVVLSYFFLIGGLSLLVLNFVALYKKLKNKSNVLHNEQ
jgi:hypothetical protein